MVQHLHFASDVRGSWRPKESCTKGMRGHVAGIPWLAEAEKLCRILSRLQGAE